MEEAKGDWIPWNWKDKAVSHQVWVLETEPLDPWAITPSSNILILINGQYYEEVF